MGDIPYKKFSAQPYCPHECNLPIDKGSLQLKFMPNGNDIFDVSNCKLVSPDKKVHFWILTPTIPDVDIRVTHIGKEGNTKEFAVVTGKNVAPGEITYKRLNFSDNKLYVPIFPHPNFLRLIGD